MRGVGGLLAAGAALALVPAPAQAGSVFDPPDAAGASELAIESHGRSMKAALSHWDWCPEEGGFCQSGVVDYAYDPDPERLPFHPRSVMRFETGRPARAVTVTFSRRKTDRQIRARRSDESGLRWSIRAPSDARAEQTIGIEADYRYRKNEQWYGGRYWFFQEVRMHRHR